MLEALALAVFIIVILAYIMRRASKDMQEFCSNCGRNTTELGGSCACPDCGYRSDF